MHLFFDSTHFKEGAEIRQIFVCFFGESKTRRIAFEIF